MSARPRVDVEKRTAHVVWTTGARVRRGIFNPYYEELSLDPSHVRMGRLTSGAAPLLDSHRSGALSDVLGVVESAQISGARGLATIRFDGGPAGLDALRRVAEGTAGNISVGYSVYRFEKTGSVGDVPVMLAVDWEPAELSLVAVGADAGAGARAVHAAEPVGSARSSPAWLSDVESLLDDRERKFVRRMIAAMSAEDLAWLQSMRTAAAVLHLRRIITPHLRAG